jgi:hypothetical protein
MARAEYLHGSKVWMILIPVLLAGPIVINVVKAGFAVDTQFFCIAIVVDVIITAFFVFALLFWSAPKYWQSKLPSGTEMVAYFGPDWVGVGWGSPYTALAIQQVESAKRTGGCLILRYGFELMIIPGQLVPQEISTDLLARIGEAATAETSAVPNPPDPSYAGMLPTGSRQASVARTNSVADEQLPDRLGRSVRRSRPVKLFVASLAAMVVLFAVVTSIDRNPGVAELFSVGFIAVLGVAIMVYYLWFRGPAAMRQLLPPGTPISAEFGSEQVAVRLGAAYKSVVLDTVKRVSRGDGARSSGRSRRRHR